jgi:ATP-dependent Lon protease
LKLRAERLIELLQKELQFAELKNKVTTKTRTEIDKQQREYFLQQQLKSIKDELGGDTNEREIAEMKKKADAKKWSDAQGKCLKAILQSWKECILPPLTTLLFIIISISCLTCPGMTIQRIIMT